MGAVLGVNCKAYRNDDLADYDAPDWVEVTKLRDVSINVEAAEADMSSRAGAGWEEILPSLRKATIETEIIYNPADTEWAAMNDAFHAGTSIQYAFVDGDIATPGTQGLRATFAVTKFSTPQPLTDGCKTSVTLRPTPYSDGDGEHPPEWITIPA